MPGEDQRALAILRRNFEEAVTPLGEYITDGSSEEKLRGINENILTELTQKLQLNAEEALAFQVPYKKIAKLLGEKFITAATKVTQDPNDEESSRLVGVGKLKLYHFCLDRGFQPAWFERFFPKVPGAKSCRPGALHATKNISATDYWPYYYQTNDGETVLFEKQKKWKDGVKSSFGVEVYDEDKDKYKVVLRRKIVDLEKWRMNKGAYKFLASDDRKYRKQDLGEVVWIYFYTTSPIKSGNALSHKSTAQTEFCVRFQNTMMPKMITRSNLIGFLGEDLDLDKITETLSHRDGADLPWGQRADKIFFSMKNMDAPSKLHTQGKNIDDLTEIFRRMGIVNPTNSGTQERIPLSETKAEVDDEAIARLRSEVGNKFKEHESRLSNIEENMVTRVYMESKFDALMGALRRHP